VQLCRYFVSWSSEFCRHNPLCCFSTSNTKGKRIFRYRFSPETFGHTPVCRQSKTLGTPTSSLRLFGTLRLCAYIYSLSSNSLIWFLLWLFPDVKCNIDYFRVSKHMYHQMTSPDSCETWKCWFKSQSSRSLHDARFGGTCCLYHPEDGGSKPSETSVYYQMTLHNPDDRQRECRGHASSPLFEKQSQHQH
jgi:hypothetical protein